MKNALYAMAVIGIGIGLAWAMIGWIADHVFNAANPGEISFFVLFFGGLLFLGALALKDPGPNY